MDFSWGINHPRGLQQESASVAPSANLLIGHFSAACLSLSPPISLLVLSGVTSQINYLHSNPCLGISA